MTTTVYQTWEEVVSLFEKRELPESTFENLYPEEYILHPGSTSLGASLRLDDHEFRDESPWIRAGGRPQYEGIDGAVTGYVIDGDLEIDGNIVNGDFGSPALIVLGNLRAKNIHIAGDAKVVVKGDVEVETLVISSPDKLMMIHGDLRTKAMIITDYCFPELVGGCVRGRVVAPPYYDPSEEPEQVRVEDPTAGVALEELLVPEVFTDMKGQLQGLDPGRLFDRAVAGLPIAR